ILTEPDGRIVDVLTRKPIKGEVAGGHYEPQEEPLPERQFLVRELTGNGSFNERIDAFYAEHGSELSRQALLVRAEKYFAQKSLSIHTRIASLEKALADSSSADRYRELGDILMACQHLDTATGSVQADDFYRGGTVSIRVDPKKNALHNAQEYYERSHKAKSGTQESQAELEHARAELARLEHDRSTVLAEENPHAIRAFLMRNRSSASEGPKRYPGLSLEVDGWVILIGRSAAENDQLLRRHVRGFDTWLHARDYSGSYVFIKAKAGKSIPLPVLLDAGMLAVYYSKARTLSAADLYYTQAKNLKRVKGGPKGLVIPQNEKNLRVMVDEKRLRELRRLIGQEHDAV
ncbi:MAG TPA: NFACT RNA binding domain-containing protein, partial [Spirochaetales bacterium]|nr:NFACT RNA binding domain-containing protein [Spirochaetales bacterium]